MCEALQSWQMWRGCLQVAGHLLEKFRRLVVDRVRRILPGCPKCCCCVCVVQRTAEAQAAMVEGEPCLFCVLFGQSRELKELSQAMLDVLVMGGGELSCQVWAKPSQGIVRPGSSTVEQQEPAGLEIWDGGGDGYSKGCCFACNLANSSWMYSSVPMGKPSTRRPCCLLGSSWSPTQTAADCVNEVMPGGKMPEAFQTWVLPWCSWMPVRECKWWARRSKSALMRFGWAVTYMSSRKAATRSPATNSV